MSVKTLGSAAQTKKHQIKLVLGASKAEQVLVLRGVSVPCCRAELTSGPAAPQKHMNPHRCNAVWDTVTENLWHMHVPAHAQQTQFALKSVEVNCGRWGVCGRDRFAKTSPPRQRQPNSSDSDEPQLQFRAQTCIDNRPDAESQILLLFKTFYRS